MLHTDITSDIAERAAQIAQAEARVEARLRGINIRAARQLLSIARSVVHVQTGRLRDSLHIQGPFDIGTGALEVAVVSNVPYAGQEAGKGGEHDYPSLTIQQGQSIIDQAAEDMELAIIAVMEGR
jgi:hypothetical protein